LAAENPSDEDKIWAPLAQMVARAHRRLLEANFGMTTHEHQSRQGGLDNGLANLLSRPTITKNAHPD
jgi:hypothetical protein